MKIQYDTEVDKINKHYVVSQYAKYFDELRNSEHENITFEFDTKEEAIAIQRNLSQYIGRHEIYDIYCKRRADKLWLIKGDAWTT